MKLTVILGDSGGVYKVLVTFATKAAITSACDSPQLTSLKRQRYMI